MYKKSMKKVCKKCAKSVQMWAKNVQKVFKKCAKSMQKVEGKYRSDKKSTPSSLKKYS